MSYPAPSDRGNHMSSGAIFTIVAVLRGFAVLVVLINAGLSTVDVLIGSSFWRWPSFPSSQFMIVATNFVAIYTFMLGALILLCDRRLHFAWAILASAISITLACVMLFTCAREAFAGGGEPAIMFWSTVGLMLSGQAFELFRLARRAR